jgi:hypothetical protein
MEEKILKIYSVPEEINVNILIEKKESKNKYS